MLLVWLTAGELIEARNSKLSECEKTSVNSAKLSTSVRN